MTIKKTVDNIKSAESTISMVLGVIVVIVVGVLLFNYFRTFSNNQATSPSNPENSQAKLNTLGSGEKQGEVILPGKYIVKANDSLWKISEKFYGTGNEWKKIKEANAIQNPGTIEIGQELTIPKLESTLTANKETNETKILSASTETISGSTYTVVKGDTLWKISVRAYQDGFQWPKIAQANNLVHPSLIHPGNVLTIPR